MAGQTWYVDAARQPVVWETAVVGEVAQHAIIELTLDPGDRWADGVLWARALDPVPAVKLAAAMAAQSLEPVPAPRPRPALVGTADSEGPGGAGLDAYDPTKPYLAGAQVTHGGDVWRALAPSTGVTPVEGASWTRVVIGETVLPDDLVTTSDLLAAIEGVGVLQGAPGPEGPQGPAGPSGPAGLNFQGLWSATATYIVDDLVTYNGSGYYCHTPPPVGTAPAVDAQGHGAFWELLVLQGAAGARGPAGPSGGGALGGKVNGAVNASQTTIAATLSEEWPTGAVTGRVLVDSELMAVTNIALAGGVWTLTVVRGQLGTTAATHKANAVVWARTPFGGGGSGLPPGGTTSQVLVKDSNDDGDAIWATLATQLTQDPDLALPLTTLTDWVAEGGTWTADVNGIRQSAVTAAGKRLSNRAFVLPAAAYLEVEVSVAGFVAAENRSGLLAGLPTAGGSGAGGVWLKGVGTGLTTVYHEQDAVTAFENVVFTAKHAAIPYGTFVRLGMLLTDQSYTSFINDVPISTVRMGVGSGQRPWLGLMSYNSDCTFRNLKVWNLDTRRVGPRGLPGPTGPPGTTIVAGGIGIGSQQPVNPVATPIWIKTS